MNQSLSRIRYLLPAGRSLPDASWWPRHRVVCVLLWAHAAGVPIFAVARGAGLVHGLLEASVIAGAAFIATSARPSRAVRMTAATLGMLTASAVVTHLSGGTIEAHFHFFVVVPLIALYQEWIPFLLAIGYVLVHHGAVGAIAPEAVYNHPAAIAHPWRWASIHAVFIAGTSAVCLTNWRLNEAALCQLRAVQNRLLDTLSMLNATIEATADGILVVNEHGHMVRFNERFLRMWRIPDEIANSRDDEAALSFVLDQLVDPSGFLAKVRELYNQPEATSVDELAFKDGRTFERYSHPQLIDGRSVGRVWSFRDVTERERAESALRDAVRQLEARDEAKNVFLTAVSHELRTPLASVVGFAQTLRDRDRQLTPDVRREVVGRLAVAAGRLQHLLADLLDVDRLSRGILEPRRRRTRMDALVGRVLDGHHGWTQRVQVDAEPFAVDIDPAMVERIVENLVANAIKHTPAGTPVGVRVVRTDGGALLTVWDGGRGVPDDLKCEIFEPFRTGDTPSHSPGTGIGLSLVHKFAALHGGRAWVEDLHPCGAAFHVLLPAHTHVFVHAAS